MAGRLPQKAGYVYVLTSRKCEHIKIGGSAFPPLKRIRQIDSCDPYRQFAPWSLFDFRQVANWRRVERHLLYMFRDRKVRDVPGQLELFAAPAARAAKELAKIDPSLVLRSPRSTGCFRTRSSPVISWNCSDSRGS